MLRTPGRHPWSDTPCADTPQADTPETVTEAGGTYPTGMHSRVKLFFIQLYLQLTWLPNEVEYFDTVLFTNIGRVLNPKGRTVFRS